MVGVYVLMICLYGAAGALVLFVLGRVVRPAVGLAIKVWLAFTALGALVWLAGRSGLS